MKPISLSKALATAASAARVAGALMRQNLVEPKKINSATQHDIKLELDVRCQKLIEKALLKTFPQAAILGEEGVSGDLSAEYRWVVDPIDGTVNFTYGIPHACVSIALERRLPTESKPGVRRRAPRYQTLVGVVYDPFCDELWTAIRGQVARLNGRPIHVSQRAALRESIISLGFAKKRETLDRMLPVLNDLVHRVRKIRIMGAAALAMVYVASGRLDAYLEYGLRWWDIAAGGLILECAGGDFVHAPIAGVHAYQILANNGPLRKKLHRYYRD